MGLLEGLTGGRVVLPDALINVGRHPLPSVPSGAPFTPDGLINQVSSLLPGGLNQPYAYGHAARISTQTQVAHPNRIAAIIPRLYLPAPESDGHDSLSDPPLDHSISDGDLVFTLRLGSDLGGYGSKYCHAPYGHAAKAVPLINLATVNYLLWGLQVGLRREKNRRWSDFFNQLTQGELEKHLRSTQGGPLSEAVVWGFIRTYLRPLGVQHGGDQQGGMHEGDSNRIVTHGAVDYVSSFAIEGRLEHVNNLWRDYDVHEHDDLALVLRHKAAHGGELFFNLSSSVRSTRTERVPVSSSFFYLRPETLAFRSFSEACYIHVGRAFKFCSMYSRHMAEAGCWDARVAVVPGDPIKLTLDLKFVDSEDIYYAGLDADNYIVEYEVRDAALWRLFLARRGALSLVFAGIGCRQAQAGGAGRRREAGRGEGRRPRGADEGGGCACRGRRGAVACAGYGRHEERRRRRRRWGQAGRGAGCWKKKIINGAKATPRRCCA